MNTKIIWGEQDTKWVFLMNGRQEETKTHSLSSLPYAVEIIPFSKLQPYTNECVLRQFYLEKGHSVKQMSVLLGCGTTTIKKWLRHYKIKKNPVQEVRHRANLKYGQKLVNNKPVQHKQESQIKQAIIDMYVNEELSITAIARLLTQMKIPTKKRGKKWDHSVISDILQREGIYQSKRQPRGKK